jgi:protein TonB
MSATTVNSFPAMHAFTSPRGIALAFIVLLHVAFFFALSSGLGIQLIPVHRDVFEVVNPRPASEHPVQTRHEVPLPHREPTIFRERMPFVPLIETNVVNSDSPPLDTIIGGPTVPDFQDTPQVPVILAPEEDRHHPLSAPPYPAAEIRADHSGTVILRVQVLENGRIGDVQIIQSSGYAKLDESALHEARRWRMKPGTRDGIPVAMWKEVPITFQLKDRGTTDF